MESNTKTFEDIHEEYCDFIESCGKFNYYTRSKIFQKQKIIECEDYIKFIKSYKQQAKINNNEYQANQFFHMQCMINSSRSFLLMWIELKENNFNESWRYLIDAQEYISIALKTSDYEGIRNLEKRLYRAELSLFPGWKFYNSPGFIETIGDCSICLKQFLECDHIESNIYLGSFCQRVNRKIIKMDHTALVENPYDKRCIITKTSDDQGYMIDYFTWEKADKKGRDDKGNYIEGVMINYSNLDLN